MHPRNIYKTPPDFSKLALKYPEFLKISSIDLNGTVRINFKDPNTLLVLTKCLLHADFGLDVDIPCDRLVPTVPLRLNYLLWLEDILKVASRKENIKGIDIGTGACCIYPLLAAVKLKWHILATEVDENSVNMALKNVKQNKLEGFISVKKVDSTQLLLHCFKTFGGSLPDVDFCMCNPPFYSSIDDMDLSRNSERPPPRNARTGSLQEIITEGGEVTFVKKLIQESLILKDKIRIYTTMLGHKSSLKPLLQSLKDSGISQVSQTVFSQGRTTRWGLAWSLTESSNLLDNCLPLKNGTKNKCMSFVIPPIVGINYKVNEITIKLLQIFKELELQCKLLQQKDVIATLEAKASKNTWSNQRKRRRELKLKKALNTNISVAVSEPSEPFNVVSIKERLTDNIEVRHNEQLKCEFSNLDMKRKSEDCLNIRETKLKKIKDDESNSNEIPKIVKNSTGSESKIALNYNKPVSSSPQDKKSATEEPPSCSTTLVSEDYLTVAVCVRNHNNYIVLEIGYVSGLAGKDGVHQIVQYIKNNWK